jgi:hypothetical protein
MKRDNKGIIQALLDLAADLGVTETEEMKRIRNSSLQGLSVEAEQAVRAQYWEAAQRLAEAFPKDVTYQSAQIGVTLLMVALKVSHGRLKDAIEDFDPAYDQADANQEAVNDDQLKVFKSIFEYLQSKTD